MPIRPECQRLCAGTEDLRETEQVEDPHVDCTVEDVLRCLEAFHLELITRKGNCWFQQSTYTLCLVPLWVCRAGTEGQSPGHRQTFNCLDV